MSFQRAASDEGYWKLAFEALCGPQQVRLVEAASTALHDFERRVGDCAAAGVAASALEGDAYKYGGGGRGGGSSVPDVALPGGLKAPRGATHARTRLAPLPVWYLRWKRQRRGECEVVVRSVSGRELRVVVRSSDDKWRLKRAVQQAQLDVEGFALPDFELVDAASGRSFGVRGASALPPNHLHRALLPDALAAVSPAVVQWRDELTARYAAWRDTIATLVDGVAFVQVVGGVHGASRPPAAASAASAAGESGAGRVADDAVARVWDESHTAEGVLGLLRSGVLHSLCEAATGRAGARDADRVVRAVAWLLRQSRLFFHDEFGPTAWKVSFNGHVHPLLSIALSTGDAPGGARRAALSAWLGDSAAHVVSLSTAYAALQRGCLTWGAPALISKAVRAVPAGLRALLQMHVSSFRIGRGRVLMSGNEALETVRIFASCAVWVLRAAAPQVAAAALYEALSQVARNVWRRESGLANALLAAAAVLSVSAAARVTRRQHRIAQLWNALRAAAMSAALWEFTAHVFGAPRAMLATLSLWSAGWGSLLLFLRLRVALVIRAA